MVLWNKILNTIFQPLEEPVTVDAGLQVEIIIADDVKKFLQILYTDSNTENEFIEKKERQVNSSAADVFYAADVILVQLMYFMSTCGGHISSYKCHLLPKY